LQQRLHAAVEADRAVILGGTHIRRAWRLAVLQALPMSQPVEWIGWWLRRWWPLTSRPCKPRHFSPAARRVLRRW
jgi:hypothetical protein